jgi:hypothetical protein
MKSDTKTGIVLLIVISACWILGGCSMIGVTAAPTISPTPYPTPDIPGWGGTPEGNDLSMPGTLSCVLVPNMPPAKSGLTWRGLTVGISTLEDVIQVLNKEDGAPYWWNSAAGNLTFHYSLDETPWTIVNACFVEGQLAALSILDPREFSKGVDALISEYGKPDRVTWGNWYEDRSMIWAEKGLLVIVKLAWEHEGKGYQTILFSPVSPCELERSWLYQSLPKEAAPFVGDVAMEVPEVQDPLHIEKGLGQCPTQTAVP